MLRSVAIVVWMLALASAAAAQSRPATELGIRGGWFHYSGDDDEDFSNLTLPGDGQIGVNTIYATIFAAPRLAVEPHFGLIRFSDDDNASTRFSVGAQLMGFLNADATRSPYVFATGSLVRASSDSNSDSFGALGAGLGYRTVVRSSLGLRFEARYRRWSNDGESVNELGLLVGMGAVLGR